MNRLILGLLCLVMLAMSPAAQRPNDILATSTVRDIRVADLPAEVAAIVRDAPTKRIALRTSLYERFAYDRLVALEARALKTTAEKIELAATASVANPTPAQVKAVYDANRPRLGDTTLEQARTQIVAFLRSSGEQKALDRLTARLRTKYKFVDGKNVNANGLLPTDVIATVAAKPVTAREFEEYARVELFEFDASLADRLLFETEAILMGTLVAAEAAAEKLDPAGLIAREVTGKLKEFSDEESAAVESAFAARLRAKYNARIVYKAPEPLVQKISVDDDPASGPVGAPVTVVMFSDFQCSACRATHPILKKVIAEFPDKIRFVVRDFPLENLHEDAFAAALAANAAHAQGKFFEYTELLYANQTSLHAPSLARYATELGLNLKKFELDSKAASTAAEVRHDKAEGRTYGIGGTPTIFVNGIKVRDISLPGIRSAVISALAK